MAEIQHSLRENQLHALAYVPLHKNGEGVVGRGVLTSEVLEVAEETCVEGENHEVIKEPPYGQLVQLHE
jgi:hypothetical protein